MLGDAYPYELPHVTNPDCADGLEHWDVAPAADGAISAITDTGWPWWGVKQGRYSHGMMGHAFLVMTRNAALPNTVSQQLQSLQPGRLYSLRFITADYDDYLANEKRENQQVIGIALDGADVEPGGWSHPFLCRYGRLWMTYHALQFRAQGPTATLSLSDWAKPENPVGPVGQRIMLNFVQVQPVFEPDTG